MLHLPPDLARVRVPRELSCKSAVERELLHLQQRCISMTGSILQLCSQPRRLQRTSSFFSSEICGGATAVCTALTAMWFRDVRATSGFLKALWNGRQRHNLVKVETCILGAQCKSSYKLALFSHAIIAA